MTSRSTASRPKPQRFKPLRRRRPAALMAAAGLPVALGVAIMLLAPGWSAQTGAASSDAPAASAPAVPLLFAGALAAVRPDIVRLPPTSADLFAPPEPGTATAPNSASPSPSFTASEAPAADVTGSLLRPGAGLAVRAAAHATGAGSSQPEPASLTAARPDAASAESRTADLRPVGLAGTPPLAGLETSDLITRSAPGGPGTFPPMVAVQHLLFTIDPAALPQFPFDHLTPLPAGASTARSGRPHG
ncbi:hypothetical protein [Blastochloris sulfoviridis]|uniref:hypothetical protein n=1 Tax=Blastochloris sulfoviridis TaxID=50712 RepID=UPI0014783501|nr:hypothetical protein [Blastochloris sulfoviridis]